jgi:Tat protein translocase TatB subunit
MGIGLGEILVILLAALVVVGPKRLPALARTLGAGLRELRRGMRELQEGLESAAEEGSPPAEDQPQAPGQATSTDETDSGDQRAT